MSANAFFTCFTAPSPHPTHRVFSPLIMSMLPRFHMKVALRAPEMPEMAAGPSAPPPPAMLCLDLRMEDQCAEDPATSTRLGSFNYDQESGDYPHEWANMEEFDAWRRVEELAYSIELIRSTVVHGKTLWTQRRYYVCLHQLSGGKSKYKKKNPDWHTKFTSKKTGCDCKIVVKLYPHKPTILGRYEEEHNHGVGLENVKYTHMLQVTRVRIRHMLELKVDVREIVCN
jgi:hypothetical protein